MREPTDAPMMYHVRPVPWPQFRADLLKEYDRPVVAKKTRKAMELVLRAIEHVPIFEGEGDSQTERRIETTADLTPALVAAFIASRPATNSKYTLRGNLGFLSIVCSRAQAIGALYVSPFRLRKLSKWVGRLPRPGQGKPRHLSREQISRLQCLAAKDVAELDGWAGWRARRLELAIGLAAVMGLRRNEIFLARIEDIDLTDWVLWVRPHGDHQLKTIASAAPLPIPPSLRPMLTSWLAHRLSRPPGYPVPKGCPWLFPAARGNAAWTSGTQESRPIGRLKSLAKRAGIASESVSVSWQMLRRSAAVHMEHHGLSRPMIKRILRHTTDRTSEEWYSEADLPNLHDAVDGFGYDGKAPDDTQA
jgi:integrase